MNAKMKFKMGIDLLMTVLLLLLMAYQIVGETLHEWLGAAMLVLFLMHNVLNARWYKNLLKGKYRPARVFGTVLNFAVLAAMVCLGYSGIVMSRHVFVFLSIRKGMALARVMHLSGAYWGFVLMSLHLGLHWGMILGIFRKSAGSAPPVLSWALRFFAAGLAGYGACCMICAGVFSYMFLKTEFAFFDFEKSVFSVFAEYIAMMALWAFIGYYAAKGLNRLPARKALCCAGKKQ